MKNSFFSRFTPKEPKFFPLLKQLSEILSSASDLLAESLKHDSPAERAEFYKNDEQEELFTTKTGWEFDLTLDMKDIFATVTMDELIRRLDQREQTRLRKEAERRAKEGPRKEEQQQQQGGGFNMGGMGGLGGITGNMF